MYQISVVPTIFSEIINELKYTYFLGSVLFLILNTISLSTIVYVISHAHTFDWNFIFGKLEMKNEQKMNLGSAVNSRDVKKKYNIFVQ